MALSARFVWLVAAGAVPVVLAGLVDAGAAWFALAGWLLVVIGLAAIDLSLAGAPREVAIERELPDRVRLGEPVEAALLVRNLGSRTLRATVRDGWQPSAGVTGDGRGTLRIPPGERRRLVLQLVPWRRGDRRVSEVTVRSVGPMGLAARQASLSAPARLRVLPPFHSRVHLPARLTRLRELDGRTPLLIRGQGTEFDSIREYVRGDDVRSIDWRATARRPDAEAPGSSRLMVRTWRPERDRRIVLVADTSRTAAARIADEPRLDTWFEASLLLAALATHAGDRVDFLAWDRRVRGRVHGATGAQLLAQMVDAMSTIDAELLEADWAAIPAQLHRLTSQRALVVLLTSADRPGSARGLLAVLPQLTRKHTVLVASVQDPAAATAARAGENLEGTYLAAAAERELLDAAGIEAAIRRLGADVVSAPPAELPPALADRYLELKAAGRL